VQSRKRKIIKLVIYCIAGIVIVNSIIYGLSLISPTADDWDERVEKAMLDYLNEIRTVQGMSYILYDLSLADAAHQQSQNMADLDTMELSENLVTLIGTLCSEFSRKSEGIGVLAEDPIEYTLYPESTGKDFIDLWLGRQGEHRSPLLNGDRIGFGVVYGDLAPYGTYVVCDD